MVKTCKQKSNETTTIKHFDPNTPITYTNFYHPIDASTELSSKAFSPLYPIHYIDKRSMTPDFSVSVTSLWSVSVKVWLIKG